MSLAVHLGSSANGMFVALTCRNTGPYTPATFTPARRSCPYTAAHSDQEAPMPFEEVKKSG